MAWSNSKIFRAFLGDVLANTTAMDLSGTPDTFKVALFPTGTTPNQDVAAASSAYNTGVWTSGTEVIDTTTGTSWPAGGRPLVTPAIDVSVANVVFWDAPDTVSADATCDLAAVFGCLVYDDTIAAPVAKQGVCYNYFGGTQSVTNGTFTVVWATNGIFRFTI